MSQFTISDEHDQWHRMYGKYTTCNLDCGAGEIVSEIFEKDYWDLKALQEEGKRGIKCGSCKDRHATVGTVRFCYEVKRDSERREGSMEAFNEIMDSSAA